MKAIIRPLLIILAMFSVVYFLPETPIDPWNAIGMKKIGTLVCAITFIQLLGNVITNYLGSRKGSIITGFLAGLVSSTATVASVARESKKSSGNITSEILIFISATIAMQITCLVIILINKGGLHYPILILILSPVVSAVAMIYIETRNSINGHEVAKSEEFEFTHVLKLTAFIVATIIISKIGQSFLDHRGMALITFIVSLFEMHGSIIANLQLHEAGVFDVKQLGSFIAISIVASYVSKLFLVYTLGSVELRAKVLRYTGVSFVTLGLGWLVLFELI
jgi:uncharacterized membrane protein (DUF4010 family)